MSDTNCGTASSLGSGSQLHLPPMPPPPPPLSRHIRAAFLHPSSVGAESIVPSFAAQDWHHLQQTVQAAAAAAAAGQHSCSGYGPMKDPRFPAPLGPDSPTLSSIPTSAAAVAAAAAAASYGGGESYLQPKRKNATRETTSVLKAWLNEHRKNPYPTKGEKVMLAILTAMSLTQVSTWFANARRRLKKENRMTWTPRVGSHNTGGDEEEDQEAEEEEEEKDDDEEADADGAATGHLSRKRHNRSSLLEDDGGNSESIEVKRLRLRDVTHPPLPPPPPPQAPPPAQSAMKPRIWSIVETMNRVDPPKPLLSPTFYRAPQQPQQQQQQQQQFCQFQQHLFQHANQLLNFPSTTFSWSSPPHPSSPPYFHS